MNYVLPHSKDLYGPNFPGDTFRVLKEKEELQYGEYRARRLVLKYVSEGGIRGIRARGIRAIDVI
jgi:hypothetical protein